MRHRVHARKLGRDPSHRKAMYRNLVTSLLEHERVETTDAKAKEVRRLADRMITLGKKGDLAARRRALSVIRERDVAAKVFGELAERFKNRPGGYTRVLKSRVRVGDAAPRSIVELVEPLEEPAPKKKAPAKKSTAKKATAKAATTKKAASKKTSTKKTAAKKTAKKKSTKSDEG